VNDSNDLATRVAGLGQNVLIPPTVFNYYSPFYRPGPEFQIHNPATAISRANLVMTLVYSALPGVTVDWSEWQSLASNPEALVDALDMAFLHGSMPRPLRQVLLDVIHATPGARAKAQAAVYVLASSQYYSVEH
jgi:hypothetical protein